KQVGHIGLLVESLDETAKLYQELFGATLDEVKTVAEQGVRVGMLGFGSGAKLELLEPLPDSRMAAALEKRGEGVQHVSFDVDDIEAEIASLVEKGVELIDKKPRRGVEGMVAFIHPKSVKGVLVELCQKD
ncbi:MAG: methylmalonyl-CoA epimerase, partial [Dehalococcoidia bacterium]|nr:methylmalonyl-CoA epimerase [Dehalococcoidia bacterium]